MRRFVITLSSICWLTSAVLAQQAAKVERLSKSMDEIAPADATITKVAQGYTWTEGPVWIYGQISYLLFADIPGNAIYKLIPNHKPSVLMYTIRLKIPGVRP
jgi:gluconolactonase